MFNLSNLSKEVSRVEEVEGEKFIVYERRENLDTKIALIDRQIKSLNERIKSLEDEKKQLLGSSR